MSYITRIASYGQTNPLPLPETMHLSPEERAEYTFTATIGDDVYLIPESEARKITPLAEHMAVGNVFHPLP